MWLKSIAWIIFAFLAIAIGIYPLAYWFADMSNNLLATKSSTLLADSIWNFTFYTHILLGGISLLIGWTQFSKKMRTRWMNVHRRVGQGYIIAVLLSGLSGLYVAQFATGGWIAKLGFTALAICWLVTTFMAYQSIRKKAIRQHEVWMIRSYALTFGAVTLRLWMPLFMIGLEMDFIDAYVIIAWLAWVPNLFVAEWLIRKTNPVRI